MKDPGSEYTYRMSLRLPTYSRFVIARIENARQKAATQRRLAWWVGVNPRTRERAYMVFSARDILPRPSYFPTVSSDGREGGYCYSLDGCVIAWIRCTCEAYREHMQPCWHAARVQLRLEREDKDDKRTKRAQQDQDQGA